MSQEQWVEFTRAFVAEQLKGLVDDVTVDSGSPQLKENQCEVIATYMKGGVKRYAAQVVSKQLMSSFGERQDWTEFFKSVIRYDQEKAQ
ncbi:hypothetical protein [uncultured Marinobacter sp.]|uniref:hypothetical protein n=1 Tax=uncultured Marinobacter sp. TaxID=187379 RepID=UPI0030DDD4BB|tara:strand:+ start:137 stop:403 length:267 start_codon:yes stop_codon:yes gene_type:complete